MASSAVSLAHPASSARSSIAGQPFHPLCACHGGGSPVPRPVGPLSRATSRSACRSSLSRGTIRTANTTVRTGRTACALSHRKVPPYRSLTLVRVHPTTTCGGGGWQGVIRRSEHTNHYVLTKDGSRSDLLHQAHNRLAAHTPAADQPQPPPTPAASFSPSTTQRDHHPTCSAKTAGNVTQT